MCGANPVAGHSAGRSAQCRLLRRPHPNRRAVPRHRRLARSGDAAASQLALKALHSRVPGLAAECRRCRNSTEPVVVPELVQAPAWAQEMARDGCSTAGQIRAAAAIPGRAPAKRPPQQSPRHPTAMPVVLNPAPRAHSRLCQTATRPVSASFSGEPVQWAMGAMPLPVQRSRLPLRATRDRRFCHDPAGPS